jgi:hypothetical protein
MAPPGPTLEFNLKRWVCGSVTKASIKHETIGLELEERDDGAIYVTKVEGLTKQFTDVLVGDKLYKFQDRDISEYGGGIDELYAIIKKELKISLETIHPNHDIQASDLLERMDIQIGDRVPLINYKPHPDYNGRTVEVLREVKAGQQYLVKLIESPFSQPMIAPVSPTPPPSNVDNDGDGYGDGSFMSPKASKEKVVESSSSSLSSPLSSSPLFTPKGKNKIPPAIRILVHAENLYYELCPEKITMKELTLEEQTAKERIYETDGTTPTLTSADVLREDLVATTTTTTTPGVMDDDDDDDVEPEKEDESEEEAVEEE